MRPVERGPCPRDATGEDVVLDPYNHARPHLIGRTGDYCWFCEMPHPTVAVEHIRYKDNNPDLRCEWSNFLLACPSCNSTKGTKVDTQADVDRHLWPHLHRTFDAFVYSREGIVRLAEVADPVFAARARATEELVGLTRRPGNGLTKEQILRGSDRRYEKRRVAWEEAVEARKDLWEQDTPVVRKQILKSARAVGFWSVWMTVFHDDEAMRTELCNEAFRGTASDRVFAKQPSLASRMS